MENLSTLLGKYGDEGDKLLFRIQNSGEKAELPPEKGLRYDLTVPFARYVVQHQNEISFPFKRYQIQPVWRADRPQKGRYRGSSPSGGRTGRRRAATASSTSATWT